MCGGRGTRLDADVEKPLLPVGGAPMVDRVLDALQESRVGAVYAATSPHAPATADHVSVSRVETPGEGYVADLDAALDDPRIDEPVLTVAADLPLLDGDVVDTVLGSRETGSLGVVVPAALKRALGASVSSTTEHEGREVVSTGLNVVGAGPDRTLCSWDARLAVNVNERSDAALAERLL